MVIFRSIKFFIMVYAMFRKFAMGMNWILFWCRWFAKRFLHPDIVAEYDYIFLWDEDLDVEHFDPKR